MKLIQIKDYLLLINKEAEIKPDDYIIHDTVEGIIEANDEWHYRGEKDDYWDKVIAYYPLTKEAKELGLPLLPPFEVDVEELAYTKYPVSPQKRKVFLEGYKAAQPKQFSLEDMKKAFNAGGKRIYECEANGKDKKCYCRNDDDCNQRHYMTIEEYIQSLSAQQLPKEFIPEYETPYTDAYIEDRMRRFYGKPILKTIINSEGKQELVGTYKY